MDEERLIELNALPTGLGARLAAQLAFVAEADRLKTIVRSSLLAAAARRENSAEHSWHLALMVVVLAEHSDVPIDVGHTVRLVVLHDFVEVYAGDSPVFDPIAGHDQDEREHRAADKLFGMLPVDQAAELRGLWDEFELGRTPEARFGQAIDRLQPMLLDWLTHGVGWIDAAVSEAMVRRRVAGISRASVELGEVADALVKAGIERGWIGGDVASGRSARPSAIDGESTTEGTLE